MAMFLVTGKFRGMRIRKSVEANSAKQAKLKAGFDSQVFGNDLSEFMDTRGVKVRAVR